MLSCKAGVTVWLIFGQLSKATLSCCLVGWGQLLNGLRRRIQALLGLLLQLQADLKVKLIITLVMSSVPPSSGSLLHEHSTVTSIGLASSRPSASL